MPLACTDCGTPFQRYRTARRCPDCQAAALARQAAAANHVRRAIKRGTLVRQACKVCGRLPVSAHHEDYSKPLDVVWLCRSHHQIRHAELRQGADQ